jgi:hypothetical protein
VSGTPAELCAAEKVVGLFKVEWMGDESIFLAPKSAFNYSDTQDPKFSCKGHQKGKNGKVLKSLLNWRNLLFDGKHVDTVNQLEQVYNQEASGATGSVLEELNARRQDYLNGKLSTLNAGLIIKKSDDAEMRNMQLQAARRTMNSYYDKMWLHNDYVHCLPFDKFTAFVSI